MFAKAETTRHFSEVRIGPCEHRGSHLQIPPQKQACQAESLQEKLGSPPHPPGPRLRASRKEDETYFTHLFFIDYFFRAAKMRGRYRDLMDPWSPHRPSLPPTRQHDQRDPPVTVDDTSVSRKSRGLLGVILGGARSVGFHRCRMTCIRHYSIIHGKFAALKILSVLPVHCTPNPNPGNH